MNTFPVRLLMLCVLACLALWSPRYLFAEDKPVIVLVHGAWGGGWAFRETEELLEQKGFRVYLPHSNRSGRTASPENTRHRFEYAYTGCGFDA